MFTVYDSLFYEIKTDDVYEDLFQDNNYLIIVITQKTVSSFLMKIKR